jgi:hypothetical protein
MKNNFENPRYHDDRHGHRQAQRRSQKESRKQEPQEKQRSMKQEDILDQLICDEDGMREALEDAGILKRMPLMQWAAIAGSGAW